MTIQEVNELMAKFPKENIAFFPTPFHRLKNISDKYGVNIYLKREDLSGPSNFGGNKVRKLEYIMHEAKEKGYDTAISVGAYQTNSAMEVCQFCNIMGIKPVIYVADIHSNGIPKDLKDVEGNLRLMKILGAEIHYTAAEPGTTPDINTLWDKMYRDSAVRKTELEAEGHKVMEIASGCVYDNALLSFISVFTEILEQSAAMNVKLDAIYHTNGTGGSLPGMIAAKYLLDSAIELCPIGCCSCQDTDLAGPTEILRRTQYVFHMLGKNDVPDEWIRSQINIDQEHYGVDYGHPTEEATEAILEMARLEGILLDPVYTGKGFSALLDRIRSGAIPKGSNICFIHTGGSGALFAEKAIIGDLIEI